MKRLIELTPHLVFVAASLTLLAGSVTFLRGTFPQAASGRVASDSARATGVGGDGAEPTQPYDTQGEAQHLPPKASLITDFEGHVLSSSNPNRVWPLASLTKLMTAVIALEEIPAESIVAFSKETIEANAQNGSNGAFAAGESVSLEDAVNAMLVASSNAAARGVAGLMSPTVFVERMNEKAKILGLSQTRFEDPVGLSPNNVSTVQDVAKLVRYIWNAHRERFEVTARPSVVIRELTTGESRTMRTTIVFAGQKDFLGGKTGFTAAARENLVSVFARGGAAVIVVVLGAEDRFAETRILLRDIYGT
ncbi:MAG: D-alanyl-D-alanine carboxypeptidase [Candidatus Colwellbacteria bacterium]|nr:D-alanyl-D-alanine carboxypeptidase [Candidatus Colwellbacteria bacterium]